MFADDTGIEPFRFTSLIQQGYKIIPTTADHADYNHTLFGPHAIEGAWCPNCHKPLLLLATIDTRDPRLGLAHLPLPQIPLLYCMRCSISWCDGDVNTNGLRQHCRTHSCSKSANAYTGGGYEFFYHVSDRGVSILVYNMGYDKEYLPYPNYPDAFPGSPVQLMPINEEEHWYCQRSNRYWEEHPDEFESANYEASNAFHTRYAHLNDWTHQLGGEPCFWNSPQNIACPCCGAVMPFLALIEDNESVGTPALSRGGGQITNFICPDCSIIGAYTIGT